MSNELKYKLLRKIIHPVSNDRGMILIISLLLLVVLSIMSVAAIFMSSNEQSIAANHEVIQNNFYALEAVCVEAAMVIDSLPDNQLNGLGGALPTWVRTDYLDHLNNPGVGLDLSLNANWPSAQITPVNTSLNSGSTDVVPPGSGGTDRIQYAVIDTGFAPGSSMTSGVEVTHAYALYAMYDVNGTGKAYPGRMLMSMGHKRRVTH